MRALVTGSSGLVGRAVTQKLLDEGYSVHGLDNHAREGFFGIDRVDNEINHTNYTHFEIDITSEEINKLKPRYDVIVHCAAQPSHDLANTNPDLDFKTNVLGTHNILELARRNSPGVTFIYLSTTKVFSDEINKDCIESIPRFVCPYLLNEQSPTVGNHGLFGAHKLASDIIVQEYGKYYDMKTIVLRPGCITGKGHKGVREHGFLSYLVKCLQEDKEYIINGYRGKQVRDQLHVSDLVSAIMEIIKKPKTDHYVIGGGAENSTSIVEAIYKLEKLTNKKLRCSFIQNREADHKWNVHDNSKFENAYPNWEIKYSLDQILQDLL